MAKAGRKQGGKRSQRGGGGQTPTKGGQKEGFVFSDRLIRYQTKLSKRRIPGGFTPEHFAELNDLLKIILTDVERAIEAEVEKSGKKYEFDVRPKELHVRLNESHKPFPLGLFVGWVESDDVKMAREAWNQVHPGLGRFGDDVLSEIYAEAFRYAAKDNPNADPNPIFRHRDWDNEGLSEIAEKRSGEKATDPKAGNRFQTCLAIVAEGRAVGTLVVGFKRRLPKPLLDVAQKVLKDWARGSNNRRMGLLDFLNGFELGGPLLKNSDWVAQIF
jgi:hypothetical protein